MASNYYSNLSDKEFDEAMNFKMALVNNKELMHDRFENNKSIRDKINVFIGEQDADWAKERRSEFLNWKLLKLLENIESAKIIMSYGAYVLGGWQYLIEEANKPVEILDNEYTRRYKELAYLNRGDEKIKGEITEEIIEKCRDVPVESHIESRVFDIGNGRKNTMCPVHQETKPSFMIYPDNSFHCFGCGLHGKNSIDFMTNVRNYTFVEAIKYLSN